MHLKGFKSIKRCRQVNANNRYFGGLCVFISNHIKQGIKVVKNDHPDIIWIKLSKDFFNLSKNLLIYFTYISPSDSEYYKNNNLTRTDLLECIKLDCAEFMSNGNILLMGDLNAYLPRGVTYFIEGDIMDDPVPLPDDVYQPDIPIPRNTMEMKNLNQNGKLLLDICKSVSLRILNGRTSGDLMGKFTRYPIYYGQNETNPLPIDYASGNHDILRKIKYFSISDLTRYSDHCIIKLSAERKFKISTENAYPNLISVPPEFKWDNVYKSRLCEAFSSTECQTSLTNFYNSTFDTNQSDIDQATSQLTNIIVHTTS